MTIDAASGANPYASLIANSDVLTQTTAAKNANKTDTSAAAAKTKTAGDKDTFLKLLVAQLRYQDPSKPADSTAFIAQTAQFSSLETMQGMAESYTSMLAAQNKLQASAYVGQTVSYTGNDGKSVTGVVKSASFATSSAGGTGGEPVLNVDGTNVVLSKVTAVVEPGAATSAAAAASTPSAPASGTTTPTGAASSGTSSPTPSTSA
ncbi:MAG: flagellar hook capping FlgD N-terminal domain-containing protein [Janthinobacterium lividum]